VAWDAIPAQQVVLLLQEALSEASDGRRGLAQAALRVDRAYALFRGGDDLYSPFARGNKRGLNFYALDGLTLLADAQVIPFLAPPL
jgi:hypothetical protein